MRATQSRSTGSAYTTPLTGQSHVAPKALSFHKHTTAMRLSACPWYSLRRTKILRFIHGPRAWANWNLQLEMMGVAAGSLSSLA